MMLKRLKEERDVKQGLKGQCHEKGMPFYRMRWCCPRTGFTFQNGGFAIYCNGISCALISQIFLQHACHFGMHHWVCAQSRLRYATSRFHASVTPPLWYPARQYLVLAQSMSKFGMHHERCGESSAMRWRDGYGLVQFVYKCPCLY